MIDAKKKNLIADNGKDKLTYLRVATKKKDGADGYLYRQTWATGFQEIVLSKEHVDALAKKKIK